MKSFLTLTAILVPSYAASFGVVVLFPGAAANIAILLWSLFFVYVALRGVQLLRAALRGQSI